MIVKCPRSSPLTVSRAAASRGVWTCVRNTKNASRSRIIDWSAGMPSILITFLPAKCPMPGNASNFTRMACLGLPGMRDDSPAGRTPTSSMTTPS